MKNKILILIASILLISGIIGVMPSTVASSPYSVKGILYFNQEVAPSDVEIQIEFSDGTENTTTYTYNQYNDETNYNLGFWGDEGQTGEFIVIYHGHELIPTDNETIQLKSDQYGYRINLNVDTTGIDDVAPAKVTGLTAAASSSSQINLNWDANSEPDLDHYNIYQDDVYIDTTTSNSYSDTGLSASTSYTYKVAAVDTSNNIGEKSNPATESTQSSSDDEDDDDDDDQNTNNNNNNQGVTFKSPNADAGGPYSGVVDEEITFDGSSSSDSDGTINGYRWDFDNDGNYDTSWLTDPTAKHIYESSGEYTVKLQVKDNDELKDTDTATVVISQPNNNPLDPTIVDGVNSGTINTDYTYTVVSQDPDGDGIKYIFDWDDETANTETNYAANNTEVNATHNWNTSGIYIIKVKAEDINNAQSGNTQYLVFIDIGNINLEEIEGYLIDNEQDGEYDQFYKTDSGEKTDLGKRDNDYLIDVDGDDTYDYQYNETSGLTVYQEDQTDDDTSGDKDGEDEEGSDNTIYYIAGVIVIIILLGLLFVATRKKEKE